MMINWFRHCINRINQLRIKTFLKIRYHDVQWGQGVVVNGKMLISLKKSSRLIIGDRVKFSSGTIYNFMGIFKPVSIAVEEGAELCIGNDSGFSGTSLYAANKIIIGAHCNFGGNTAVWDTDFHPLEARLRRVHDRAAIKTAPVIIGDDVFVGANSLILKGVTIGDRVIIGAGSVISKDIPADEIWAGNPARFIRKNLPAPGTGKEPEEYPHLPHAE